MEMDYGGMGVHTNYLAFEKKFVNVFRATKSKTTPLPAALNQARGIDTMYCFISSQTCYMILQTYRYHQINTVTLREDT
jgi:hypothetical protein